MSFKCPYCRQEYPDYYIPYGHERVAVICFDCHVEEQDLPKKARTFIAPRRPKVRITERQYEAWKLVCVDGKSQTAAAKKMGIAQANVCKLLRRIGEGGIKSP